MSNSIFPSRYLHYIPSHNIQKNWGGVPRAGQRKQRAPKLGLYPPGHVTRAVINLEGSEFDISILSCPLADVITAVKRLSGQINKAYLHRHPRLGPALLIATVAVTHHES